MMKNCTFLIQFFSQYFLYGHITHEETCTDDMNVTEHKSQIIVMRTCNKTQKYLIAYNFFNFDRNIGMLYLKIILLKRGIQLNKNFWSLSYPVLTTTQNDKKLHIFDSNSLVILSIWTWHEETCTDDMNVTEHKA